MIPFSLFTMFTRRIMSKKPVFLGLFTHKTRWRLPILEVFIKYGKKACLHNSSIYICNIYIL